MTAENKKLVEIKKKSFCKAIEPLISEVSKNSEIDIEWIKGTLWYRFWFFNLVEMVKKDGIAERIYNTKTENELKESWSKYYLQKQGLLEEIKLWADEKEKFYGEKCLTDPVPMYEVDEDVDILEIAFIIAIVGDEIKFSDEDIWLTGREFYEELKAMLNESPNPIIRKAGAYIEEQGMDEHFSLRTLQEYHNSED